ncbi:hypothetical protein VNI00_019391 [Paramarasmius palmivorus]|uniref:Uncharacterized protein n=1 Tax=Paramarasmius palmivorus TaxID=297713 RepID=A0AAW0AMP7_9AGAR
MGNYYQTNREWGAFHQCNSGRNPVSSYRWKQRMRAQKWMGNPNSFRHPKGTITVNQTQAKQLTTPRVDDLDLKTLPYSARPAGTKPLGNGREMPLTAFDYSRQAVIDLAKRKAEAIGEEFSMGRRIIPRSPRKRGSPSTSREA